MSDHGQLLFYLMFCLYLFRGEEDVLLEGRGELKMSFIEYKMLYQKWLQSFNLVLKLDVILMLGSNMQEVFRNKCKIYTEEELEEKAYLLSSKLFSLMPFCNKIIFIWFTTKTV